MLKLLRIYRIKDDINWGKLRTWLFFLLFFVILCFMSWISGKDFVEQNKSESAVNVSEIIEKKVNRVYEDVKVSRLILNNQSTELHMGEEFELITEVFGDEKIATFVSDNTSVVGVSESGIIKAVGCGQANVIVEANGLIKKCVVSVVPVEEEPVISILEKSKNNNTKKYVQITLNKPEFRLPTSDVYGEYLQYATDLYTSIVNKEDFYFAFDFTSREEALIFRDMVNNNMLPTGVCLFESLAHGYDRLEDGTFVEYYRMVYDKSWINSKNVDVYKALENPYNACINAGLINGISETDAVKKISNWIANHMVYEHNNGDSYVGFTTGKGQCHTYAEMFRAMCYVANIKCEYVKGNTGENHAWNKVYVDGNWYYVDTTWYDSTNNDKYILAPELWDSHSIIQE